MAYDDDTRSAGELLAAAAANVAAVPMVYSASSRSEASFSSAGLLLTY